MKKVIKNAVKSISRRFRRDGAVAQACLHVREAILGIRESLKAFEAPLAEKGDIEALRVIEDLERLADDAYSKVRDHFDRVANSMSAVNRVESPLQVKDGTNSSWAPTTWTGIHAELMTYFVQSIEICRHAVDSAATIDDNVTRYMLLQVLALFEEMLYIAEMNPPRPSAELLSLGERVITEVQIATDLERKSCALTMCSPTGTLKVVSGTIELPSNKVGSAWFVPNGGPARHFRLNKHVAKRLICVHPERQPLLQGCAHMIELSATEMAGLTDELRGHIVQPLLELDATAGCYAVDSS